MNAPVYSLAEQIENTDILDKLILSLRSKRPKVSASLPFTAYSSGKILQIWINTPACRFNLKWKCAACDYLDSIKSESAIRGVCDYIKSLGSRYETLLLNTCGSCMCEDELPFDDIMVVVHAISETSVRRVVLETHLAYASIEKMAEIKNVLADRDVCLEYGQESTSSDVLKYCLNKPSMLLKYDVVEELQKMGVRIIANVLLGIPFLSVRRWIEDAISSIRDLLEQGIDEIMLFLVNIKTVSVYIDGRRLVFENECTSIPDSEICRLFEPFYRPDFSRSRESGGNGLGLYIVDTLLTSMGIPYSFVSMKSPQGMCFIIQL